MVKVLLVEDSPEVADSVVRALELRGHTVDWAITKHDAEAVIDSGGPFDMAILDLNLPDGYGPELLGSLRKTKTCVCSGLPDDARHMCDQLGFPDVPVFCKGTPMDLWDWVEQNALAT